MPLRLAILKAGAAESIIAKNTGIKKWYIGGHSLGGTAAALFAFSNRDAIDGLILLASYPAGSSDLSVSGLSVLSVSAEKDGIINMEAFGKSAGLLPPGTVFIEIKGANHSQFGDYGLQEKDSAADIDVYMQHGMVIQYMLEFMGN